MSCRGKVLHALGQCDCFKPGDYAALVETERLWFELLIRLARHGANHPSGQGRVSALILHERTRWLRN
jgi:hypothetical protein